MLQVHVATFLTTVTNIFLKYFIILDIDECLEAAIAAKDLCESDKNSQCLNTEGSFECVCVPGYEKLNETCARKHAGMQLCY